MDGGYKIIDLKDTNLITNGESIIIKGIYENIKTSYRKALLIENIVIDGVEKQDCFIDLIKDGTNFKFDLGNETLTITQDDMVRLTNFNLVFYKD